MRYRVTARDTDLGESRGNFGLGRKPHSDRSGHKALIGPRVGAFIAQ